MPAHRILVVEDDRDSSEILELILASAGYAVRTAADASEALMVAVEHRPEVAIIDIGLPVVSGLDVAIKLQSLPELELCRYIALSGYIGQGLPELTLAAGFQRRLLKPVGAETILQAVAELLRLNA